MSVRRWVSEDGILRVIRSALLKDQEALDRVTAAVSRYLGRQPSAPKLIGSTAAARVLGILPPHISRLREQGRMPEPVQIEGSVEAYHRDEIEALARELQAERDARKEKKSRRESDEAASGA